MAACIATTSDISRRSVLGRGLGVAAAAMTPHTLRSAAHSLGVLTYTGVNLAGAEFGSVPGVHGRDYAYPTTSLIDYYSSLGFNLIRLPFLWERLQPEISGDLNQDEQARLTAVAKHATSKDLRVILDPHNYAHRKIAADGWAHEHAVGSITVPGSALADLWTRLAKGFKHDRNVIFGLMNEPKEMDSIAWLPIANESVAAIRATGASNLILVPGVAYSGAHSWLKVRNSVMAELKDPGGNFAFDVHQYLDADSSGTSPRAVSATIGSQRIEAFQVWARSNGFKAFLGEFGAAENPTSLQALEDLCRALQANSDVWIGWAAWAGGAWWPEDYMFNLDPTKTGGMRAQTRILANFARARRS